MNGNKFKFKKSIVLIGMAGAGKSTVGKILSKKLGYEFIDGDKFIENQEGVKLQNIINQKGEEYFLKIEEEVLMKLAPLERRIISPGGSVVYSEKLMDFFKNNALVIWLDVPFFAIQKRISKRVDRGVIFRGKKTLKEVFYDRRNLYRKYADLRIDCRKISSFVVVKIILNKIFGRTAGNRTRSSRTRSVHTTGILQSEN